MKVPEFRATVQGDDTFKVPPHVAAQLPKDRPVRFVVLVPEDAEDALWQRLTEEQFASGYGEDDAIYDAL